MALFGLGGRKSTVGLDIGSGLIKVVIIDHGGGEPELSRVATTPVLADAIVEGEVMNPAVISEAIRGLFTGIKQKRVVVAVGGRDVIVKKIQVDRMKESDAAEVVRWEAQQHVPFDIEGVELDFQVLDPDGDGLQMDVLLVAAKRELVETKVTLLADAGLQPEKVEVDAFALHNAFELSYPEAMLGVVALANIGHEVTNVNILQDGIPLLSRDLSVGTKKFREDLQRDLGMSSEDAEHILSSGEPRPELSQYVTSRGDEIALGVERAAAFLQAASRETSGVQSMYISGGGSRVHGMAEALSSRLGVPVEVANPLQRLRVKDGVFDTVEVDQLAPLLMQGIGLALRTRAGRHSGMRITINLLPGAKKRKTGRGGGGLRLPDFSALAGQIKDPLLIGAVGLWVVGISLIGWVWYTQTNLLNGLQPSLLEARSEARRFEQMIAQKTRQQVLRDSLVLELDAIRAIDGDRFVWPHIMEEVTRALPDFTWLVALDAVTVQDQILEDGSVVAAATQFTIDGRSSNIQSFTRFMTRLQDSPWFTDIRTSGTNTVIESERTVRAFQITGTFQMADSAFIRTRRVTEMFIEGG